MFDPIVVELQLLNDDSHPGHIVQRQSKATTMAKYRFSKKVAYCQGDNCPQLSFNQYSAVKSFSFGRLLAESQVDLFFDPVLVDGHIHVGSWLEAEIE